MFPKMFFIFPILYLTRNYQIEHNEEMSFRDRISLNGCQIPLARNSDKVLPPVSYDIFYETQIDFKNFKRYLCNYFLSLNVSNTLGRFLNDHF